MSLLWEGFLPRVENGNLGGTFSYFDESAQFIFIEDINNALVSTYGEVELGHWEDIELDGALRVGRFGLSQFVPRHVYNGEIWAVGITPNNVPAEGGRYPTPAIPQGFYLYRYKYYEDLTNILDTFDTSEQSENQIKDAGVTIENLAEETINKTSSIFSPGSSVVFKFGMGDSTKMYLSTIYIDEIDWDKTEGTTSLSGRNAIGYYLSEQTFDESVQYEGTRTSVISDILVYSGIDMKKVHIEESENSMTALFEPGDTLLYGVNHLIDIFGWKMVDLPNGLILIGSPAYLETFMSFAVHEVSADEALSRGITLRVDGAYSRLALQSRIHNPDNPEDEGFTRTVYKDVSYFDGWSIGGRRTLYIDIIDNQSQEVMEELVEEYAKAYKNIGVNVTRETPIRPEIQSGDVIKITDAHEDEYVIEGIVTGVKHEVNVKDGTAITTLNVDSGGTIETEPIVKTYTAYDVTGDTRRRELLDVIRKTFAADAAKKLKAKNKK